ncbi:hypothetical protein DB771_27375 [Burkholderia sp. AU29985]|nr:hypothetical protein EGY28_24550 [Burkholderia dolosa]PRE56723.1 hypothetical protein C6P87_01970 [Burkholderia sp. AU12872]PUA73730.1 hypothetical protein DB771_27375 [Burkholderia sp. AU29985]
MDGRPASRPAFRTTGALRRFFFAPPDISRYEKFFCVVKNHAAWHNACDCRMGKYVSHCKTEAANR